MFQYPLSGRVWWSTRNISRQPRQVGFQYPLSGRVWWSILTRCYITIPTCFSTLCRVGFGGAQERQSPDPFCQRFSTLCRVGFGGARALHCAVGRRQSFSTLCRVGFGGAKRPLLSDLRDSVSVPSVGSGLVELTSSSAPVGGQKVSVPSVGSGLVERVCRCLSQPSRLFQYPLSGRVWWSSANNPQQLQHFRFSTLCRVGFGGAPCQTGQRAGNVCFSTLCRVGFGGARGLIFWCIRVIVSVPSVGSGLVERSAQQASGGSIGFQYPLSGRVWWSESGRTSTFIVTSFQYPLSGRVWWSVVPEAGKPATRCVSVPSVGSGLVEPHHPAILAS